MAIKTSTTVELEEALGKQIRRARLRLDIDQATLADRASISVGALRNLEAGKGARLTTLVRVLRSLDLEDWLLTLEPEPEIGPLDRLRGIDQVVEPKRASKKKARTVTSDKSAKPVTYRLTPNSHPSDKVRG
ncbi:helix-turn-helix transcriptional regulator [Demequina capsici]|uniref:Helix-turn-helix transcriptional regulator n=1 Tax=Demequina capsici TaxID=3075620 RepID=A0AA96FCM1_9MICO|nr:helix-turn-helix transcriptional regulator [Demequina sp. PMTSA13]WNM27353.1 helix-turn-helix transcriptional regulator [Demequina sp. PMTSA13]